MSNFEEEESYSTEQDEKDTISYHDHPVNEDKIKAESWLNCRTKVYWNKMETHYHGLVTEVGLFKNVWKAKVEYDDGDVFWENIEDLQILKKGNPAKLKKQISNPLKKKKITSKRKYKFFSDAMVRYLIEEFKTCKYPSIQQKELFAAKFNVTVHQIDIWFKNRRARSIKSDKQIDEK